MATYIPGSKSYMPEFKPFTPDYKFLSSVLDIKTDRYNTNYQQLNDLYSKIVYAPLSREDTQTMRDQYTAGLADKLQKISGMDLSLIQNVDAAKAVFKPFFEEDIIVGDMVRTKAYQNERAFANRLMNDPERERREMWWQTGIKGMDYQMQDFINASKEDALNMPIPKYVPNANLYELSLEILKESGLNVKMDELSPDGQWIITRENGDLVTGPALEMVQRTLYDDPRVQQAYFTQSYVDGRDEAQKMIDAGAVNSVEEGQRQWALKTINTYTTKAAQRKIEQQDQVSESNNSNASWEIFRKNKGIIPGSKQEKQMREQFELHQSLKDGLDYSNNIVSEGVMPTSSSSTQDLLNRAYNMIMQFNIKEDMIAAARAFGKINASTTIKMENPEYARQRKFQYSKALESIKQKNRIDLEVLKASLDPKNQPGVLTNSTLNAKPGGPGNIEFVEGEDGSSDIVKFQLESVVEMDNVSTENKIKSILFAIRSMQPGVTDNMFTLTLDGESKVMPIGGIDSKDGKNFYQLLRTPDGNNGFKYKKDIDRIFSTYNNILNPSAENAEEMASKYPHLAYDNSKVDANPDDAIARANRIKYLQLKANFDNTNRTEAKIIDGTQRLHNHYYDQYKLIAAAGKLFEGSDAVKEFTEPDESTLNEDGTGKLPMDFLFTDLGDGNHHLRTKQEFINEYVRLAKAGKLTDGNRGWWSQFTPIGPDSGHDENYIGDTYRTEMRLKKQMDGPLIEEPVRVYAGKGFLAAEAKKDAAMLYDLMYSALNKTQGGMLAPDIQEVLTEGGTPEKVTVSGNPTDGFTTFNFTQFMRGREYLGTVGDLIINPQYDIDIDPATINQDPNGASIIMDIIDQFNQTPTQNMTIQPGDMGRNAKSDFNAVSDAVASNLFRAYIRDMKSWSSNPDQPQAGRPQATITYNNVYGNPEQGKKEHAAYVITFDQEWVKKTLPLIKTSGTTKIPAMMTPAALAEYSTLTFAFDQDMDVSVRRDGMYNYSYIQDQINTSDNKQYFNSYTNGGSIQVYQDVNGEHMARIVYQQYDGTNEANNFVNLPAREFSVNQWITKTYRGGTVESHLDDAIRQFEMTLEDKMNANNKLYEADAKQNGTK